MSTSSSRWLPAGFLLASAAVSVLLLHSRNLYDDELLSLAFAADRVRTIVAIAAEGDVHPPGMYLLAHVGWLATHSYRWLNLVPTAVLYAGLTWFVMRVAGLFRTLGAQICFLLLATLHPELLLWSNTFRWYCPWTGLSLMAIVIALRPGVSTPEISNRRAVALGALLASLFYLNYITLLFAAALAIAMLQRYGPGKRRELLRRIGLAGGCFVVLIAPQIHTLVAVHLRNGAGQRYRLLTSLLRLGQGLSESEAYLPWEPLALATGVLLLALCGVAVCSWTRRRASNVTPAPDGVGVEAELFGGGLESLMLLGVIFAGLLVVSGLGGKPRSGLALVPLLATFAATGVEIVPRGVQACVLAMVLSWCGVGIAHEAGGYGLLKAERNDRPEQVVRFVEQNEARHMIENRCAVVVTYDPGLAFALAQAKLPGLIPVSPYRGVPFAQDDNDSEPRCDPSELYVVRSYIGGSPIHVAIYTNELDAAERSISGSPGVVRLDPDPEARRKRRLAGLAGIASTTLLPDNRFTVVYGRMGPGSAAELRGDLPHFYGLGQTPRTDQ